MRYCSWCHHGMIHITHQEWVAVDTSPGVRLTICLCVHGCTLEMHGEGVAAGLGRGGRRTITYNLPAIWREELERRKRGKRVQPAPLAEHPDGGHDTRDADEGADAPAEHPGG